MTRSWDAEQEPFGSLDASAGADSARARAFRERVARLRPKRRGTRAAVLVTTGVLTVNALAVGGLLSVGAMPFQFGGADFDDLIESPPTVTAADTPASQAVAATIATEVPGYTATADTNVGGGGVVAFPCTLNTPTQPVVGQYRFYSTADRTVSATVSAYPPGTGPWVMEGLAATLSDCADTRPDVNNAKGADGLGVQAVSADLPSGSVVLWRRGDVLVQVVGPAGDVRGIATALDGNLAANLTACADTVGTLGDERRNPWLTGVPYEGLLADSEVRVDPLGAPPAPAGLQQIALNQAPVALTPVNRPNRPAEPVWPLALPAEVPTPTAPASPGQEPVATVIKVPQIDRLGPGCGWAFTATTAPLVDEANIEARREALRSTARTNLLAQQQAWRPAVVSYYQQWADYLKAVNAYQQYAMGVAIVATAWQKIETDRANYYQALGNWEAAVAARDDFFAAQAQARTDYLAAIAYCALPEPTPTPTPTPTPSPTLTPTPTPTPTPTAQPSAIVSGAAVSNATIVGPVLRFARVPVLRPGCPAQRPSILDEAPPYVPAKPSPPADPRPPAARN